MFNRGTIVWAKLKSYPWWPAIVINPEDCGRDTVKNNKLWLFWFGDHKVTEVECSKIKDFEKHFGEKYSLKMSRFLKSAIQEVLIILADRYNIEYSEQASLFKWATEGFVTSMPLPSGKSNSLELPDIVKNTLQKDCFKQKCENDEEEDRENKIVNALNDVLEGRKSLEDICVMCCKSENSVIMEHPLFVGGVCQNCKEDMYKIMNLRGGNMNSICVLCGQGGNLVYCCYNKCLCAYCETCIDYMAPKESFSKILKDNEWECYLCKPNRDVGCLIQRRENDLSASAMVPTLTEKVPIRL